jgi:hypothetical protein
MATSAFICWVCEDIITSGWFSPPPRYECPRHRFICEKHVRDLFGALPECKECGHRAVAYLWNNQQQRYEKRGNWLSPAE